MSGILLAEHRKIWTTRLWWIMAIAVFAGAAVYAAVFGLVTWLSADQMGLDPFTTEGDLANVYNGGNTLARILVLVFGVMIMGGEYRYKTLATSYLVTPRRLRLVGAKAVVLLLWGLVLGVISLVAGLAVGAVFVGIFDGTFFLDSGSMWLSLVMGAVSLTVWTMIGMGIGILIRNMVVAILVGVAFAYIVEPMLSAVFFFQQWEVAMNLMPTGATNAMLNVNSPMMMALEDPWPWWAGLLVLLGWGLVPAVAGVLVTVRKDVE